MNSQPWSNQIQKDKTLPIKGNSAFYFVHNPKNWEMYEFDISPQDKRKKADKLPLLLPSFSTLRITAGVNGVRDSGRPDPSIAVAKLQQDGMTVINPNDHDYLRLYPARGGTFYADKWTSIQILANEAIFEFDHDGFAEFRRHLILNGTIATPHKHFIQLLQISKQRSIDRIAMDQHIPERAIQLKKRQRDIRLLLEFKSRLESLGLDAYDLQV